MMAKTFVPIPISPRQFIAVAVFLIFSIYAKAQRLVAEALRGEQSCETHRRQCERDARARAQPGRRENVRAQGHPREDDAHRG